MVPFRPNANRARIAVTMIWAVLGIEIIFFATQFLKLYFMHEVSKYDRYWDWEMIRTIESMERYIAIITFIVFYASATTYIMWFRRAFYNLRLVDRTISTSDGWCAGAWFIPIYYFFGPFQLMREMYTHTVQLLRMNIKWIPATKHSSLLGWWWGLWVFDRIWTGITVRVSWGMETFDEIYFSTSFGLWGVVISVPLTILAVRVIQEYAGMERVMVHLQGEQQKALEKY
jgi:hypothetical protein